jgi:hypothetical protein
MVLRPHRKLGACLLSLAMLLAPAFSLRADDSDSDAPVVATAVAMEGHAQLSDNGGWTEIALGQLFSEGDRVRTDEDSSLHLILADGSSLVLGPNSDATLKAMGDGSAGSKTIIQLASGILNTMVEKLKSGSIFEVDSGDAVAAVKGTDFEVQRSADADATVTVNEGTVNLGDQGMQHFQAIKPGMVSRYGRNGAERPRALTSDERHAFRLRWAAAHRVHKQRQNLLRRFRRSNPIQRRKFVDAVKRRRALRGNAPAARGVSHAQARQNEKAKHPGARRALRKRKKPEAQNP